MPVSALVSALLTLIGSALSPSADRLMGCLLSRLAGAGCWLKTLLTGLTSLIGFVGDGFVSTHSVAEKGVDEQGQARFNPFYVAA